MSDYSPHFLKLFLAHQRELRGFIGSLVRDHQAREDVFQETALSLWKGFGDYDTARSFGAWARGVASNKIKQCWRNQTRTAITLPPEAVDAICEAYARTEESTVDQRALALNRCLEKLPAKARQALSLKYGKGQSGKAIATALGSTLDAVHQLLSRLRASLADCIQRQQNKI